MRIMSGGSEQRSMPQAPGLQCTTSGEFFTISVDWAHSGLDS